MNVGAVLSCPQCLQLVSMPRRLTTAGNTAAAAASTVPNPNRDSDNDTDEPAAPAVLISPIKARAAKRGIANKTDKEVWGLPDSEIIGEWSFFYENRAHSCVFTI